MLKEQETPTPMPPALPDWITPDWPAPPQVQALCSTRHGGVSAPPWDSLNLGLHVGDDAQAVQTNWQRLRQTTCPGVRWVRLEQVHAAAVATLDKHSPDGSVADASTTQDHGLACAVLVADCLPVLFTNRAGTRVAAAHAGWRGLAAGVLEKTLQCFSMEKTSEQAPNAINNEVMAWLGPCIGSGAFEVGTEVRDAFCSAHPLAQQAFTPAEQTGKYLADLAALARQRLRAAGVTQLFGNDGSVSWCTVSNPSRFFSHRRDTARLGASGRMAAGIWLKA